MTLRLRRLREPATLREALAETRLHAARLIQPHFVREGDGPDEPIEGLPGIARTSIARLLQQAEADLALGLRALLLFGVTSESDKDDTGSAAVDPDGLVPRAVTALRRRFGEELLVITDVCLCGATEHGHCGLLRDGRVLNDESLPHLAAAAVAHARAGADMVAPSDMLDLRVAALRAALDEAGFTGTPILSYSSKFASGFYGPFRTAAGSAPRQGDRRGYQLDPRNGRQALAESLLDEAEGADLLMVKPALAYLDVIAALRAATTRPIVAYNVSGEYGMVKAAAAAGWADESRVVPEILVAMARAGADLIVSYHAREALRRGWID